MPKMKTHRGAAKRFRVVEHANEALLPLLGPSPADWWTAHPVSTLVNNPRNNAPECVAPLNP